MRIHPKVSVALCTLLLLCACRCATAAQEERITTTKAFPVVGDSVTIGLRVFAGGAADGARVVFAARMHDSVENLGSAHLQQQEDGSYWCGTEWAPRASGHWQLHAIGDGIEAMSALTVIERPMHFVWYGAHESLRYATAVTPPPRDPELKQRLQDMGVAMLDWKGIGRPSVDVTAEYWGDYAHDGIAIDEIGLYDHSGPEGQYSEKALTALKALAPFRQAHPEGFLAVWNAGSLTPLSANYYRASADLVLLECYLNYVRAAFGTHTFSDYLDQRIEMARRMDVLQKCVMALGITRERGGVTPAEIINQIEYSRLAAPECPGIAWFRAQGEDRVDPEVLRIADEAAWTYFIRPCLMVRDRDLGFVPTAGEGQGTLCLTVRNIGALTARGVNVAFYLGHPEHGGKRIGSRFIPQLNAARGWSKELDDLPAAELNNRAYGIVEAAVEWSPEPGSYEVYARIFADRRDCTLLSDLAHTRVIVGSGADARAQTQDVRNSGPALGRRALPESPRLQ